MTKKEARGCITRTVCKYVVSEPGDAMGEAYEKLPTPGQLAKEYPNGYNVTTEKKLYALPLAKFLDLAEEVEG